MNTQANIGLIVLLIAGAVAALGGGGYVLVKNNPEAVAKIAPQLVQSMMPRVSEKDFMHIQDPEVRKHMAAQANRTMFRLREVSSGKGGFTLTEMKLNGIEYSYRALMNDGEKDISDMITIGKTVYVKDYGDNTWWKQVLENAPEGDYPIGQSMSETKMMEPSHAMMIEAKGVTYTKRGEEPCGTLTCFKYQESLAQTEGAKRTFWFDTKDYLLRKEEFAYGEFLTTNEYTYDAIEINTPSPTKDVPGGKSIYDYMQRGGASVSPGMGDQMLEIEGIENNLQMDLNEMPQDTMEYDGSAIDGQPPVIGE